MKIEKPAYPESIQFTKDLHRMFDWCYDNFEHGSWYRVDNVFCFLKNQDAILFKMVHGGVLYEV